MKCSVCGMADLIQGPRDLPYTYKGVTTTFPKVTVQFCPACNESILGMDESQQVIELMLAFSKEVDTSIVAKASSKG